MSRTSQFFRLGGGLDLVTSRIEMAPGSAVSAANHEPTAEGYRRMDGYERYDGHPSPSAASYWVLPFDNGTGAISAGDIVVGGTSSATGTALFDASVESGTWAGGDAAGALVLTAVAGLFQDGEALQVGGTTRASARGEARARGADNDTDDATWLQAAITAARVAISAPAGSGPIRGVWVFDGTPYAVRDNAAGTAGVLHKATSAGWVAQNLGYSLPFTSGGTTEIVEGDTISGATSGATATVGRVIVTSGTWAGANAAGTLILTMQTGTFSSESLNIGAITNVATIAGDSIAHELPAGGCYEFVTHNFFGASALRRMYGCNGVGRAFEWDGTVFVPLTTGMAVDKPNHITCHANHLFLSFPGGSVQHSAIGDPYSWSVLLGAGEIGIGDDVTGLLADVAGALVIFARNKVAVLYGTSGFDWSLKTFSNDSGAVAWTAQMLGSPLYMDDHGLRYLDTTQAFGDFRRGTLTQAVEPLLRAKKRAGITPVASCRVRSKDQYRLFWSDGTALVVWTGGEAAEILPLSLEHAVSCVCSSEDADGDEMVLFGSTDGMVYHVDKGTSFDGSPISAYVRLAYNHAGSPSRHKRWHMVMLELTADPAISLGITADFSYGDPAQPQHLGDNLLINATGGAWNENNWNDFYWSSPAEGQAIARVVGIGTNISVLVASESATSGSYTLHGMTLDFSPRRQIR